MANLNSPSGLWPVRMADGSPYYPHVTLCYAPASYGTAIFLGDPVMTSGTANAAETLGWPIGRLPEVNVAADGDGDPIWGVCIGVVPVTASSTIYREASTLRLIEVDRRPNVVWRCQTDALGTALTVAEMGLHTSFKVGTGSTVTGRSGWTIDTSITPSVDVSQQILLENFSDLGPGKNEVGSAYSWVDFIINNHALMQGADLGRSTGL